MKFFSHTTTRTSLTKILRSGAIKTPKDLGSETAILRNIDGMVPTGNSVSTGRNVVYHTNQPVRAILFKQPTNKATHLGKESIFEGSIKLDPKSTQVIAPKEAHNSLKKFFPQYKYLDKIPDGAAKEYFPKTAGMYLTGVKHSKRIPIASEKIMQELYSGAAKVTHDSKKVKLTAEQLEEFVESLKRGKEMAKLTGK